MQQIIVHICFSHQGDGCEDDEDFLTHDERCLIATINAPGGKFCWTTEHKNPTATTTEYTVYKLLHRITGIVTFLGHCNISGALSLQIPTKTSTV